MIQEVCGKSADPLTDLVKYGGKFGEQRRLIDELHELFSRFGRLEYDGVVQFFDTLRSCESPADAGNVSSSSSKDEFSPHPAYEQMQVELLGLLQPTRNPQLFDFECKVDGSNQIYREKIRTPLVLLEMIEELFVSDKSLSLSECRDRPYHVMTIKLHRSMLITRSVFSKRC
jgi:hypothetical protein